jgi:hypothetical protein
MSPDHIMIKIGLTLFVTGFVIFIACFLVALWRGFR